MAKQDQGHETREGVGLVSGGTRTVEEARRLHHLASADPERDGMLTGPAHEEKYGLERAEHSAALWRSAGVHPTENRALVEGEDGAENLRGAENLETATAQVTTDNTAAPTAENKR